MTADMSSDTIQIYEVGGAVRDSLLGLPVKDVDFTVVAPSYDEMVEELQRQGFIIWQPRPEHLTVRCAVPEGHPLRERTKDADFVMARKDGTYSDGRRPDFVEPGTLEDDLARRDFTVNAMALDLDGTVIDLHGGLIDLEDRVLRFVGDPMERITEDGLRVMRALRFNVTKGFSFAPDVASVLNSWEAADMLRDIPVERIGAELDRMLRWDTLESIRVLQAFPKLYEIALGGERLHLQTSLKPRPPRG